MRWCLGWRREGGEADGINDGRGIVAGVRRRALGAVLRAAVRGQTGAGVGDGGGPALCGDVAGVDVFGVHQWGGCLGAPIVQRKASINYAGGTLATAARIRLHTARERARRLYPDGWASRLERRARAAVRALPAWGADGQRDAGGLDGLPECLARQAWPDAVRVQFERFAARYAGALWADMSDAEVRAVADQTARDCGALIRARLVVLELPDVGAGCLEWLAAVAAARHADLPRVPAAVAERGGPDAVARSVRKRLECPIWWRRALRRYVARMSEGGALALGIVSKRNRQPYASNRAVSRRLDQNKRNRAALENTMLANDRGDVFTLAELVEKSPSAKNIRRGELMTRIRGCEELADAAGHVGLFLTLTCPSRFHSTLRDGRANPKHDGSTPRDGQAWLCAMWARARAALARRGVGVYGFRVAEPHHDGCVHWHALLWVPDDRAALMAVSTLWAYWLSDDGDEPGADQYRLNVKRMHAGGAAGYVAKYVAKNIDDHAISDHVDDYADGEAIGPDLLGDVEVKPCMRVEAWAAHWGIRQFQGIGQPPVTVWRELRRIKADAVARHPSGVLRAAWQFAHRRGGALADWAGYVSCQGGLMTGRRYRIGIAAAVADHEGQYETIPAARPVGVEDRRGVGGWCLSDRRIWRRVDRAEAARIRGAGSGADVQGGAHAPAPRTGFDNCTRSGPRVRREWAGLIEPGPRNDGDLRDAVNWWREVREKIARNYCKPISDCSQSAPAGGAGLSANQFP